MVNIACIYKIKLDNTKREQQNEGSVDDFSGRIHMGLFVMPYLSIVKLDICLMFLIGGIVGSYLPDADIKTSTAGKFLPFWLFWKHREQTHSLYFATCCGTLAGVFNLTLGAGIMVGMLLHLCGDKCTAMGQLEGLRYLLYPWKNHYKETLYRARKVKQYSLKK